MFRLYPRIESLYTSLGRSNDFETWLRKLLDERPDDDHARLALAGALAARGENAEAQGELKRLLEKDPDGLAARAALGRIQLADRRMAEAAKSYGELLDLLERQGLLRRRESLH